MLLLTAVARLPLSLPHDLPTIEKPRPRPPLPLVEAGAERPDWAAIVPFARCRPGEKVRDGSGAVWNLVFLGGVSPRAMHRAFDDVWIFAVRRNPGSAGSWGRGGVRSRAEAAVRPGSRFAQGLAAGWASV